MIKYHITDGTVEGTTDELLQFVSEYRRRWALLAQRNVAVTGRVVKRKVRRWTKRVGCDLCGKRYKKSGISLHRNLRHGIMKNGKAGKPVAVVVA